MRKTREKKQWLTDINENKQLLRTSSPVTIKMMLEKAQNNNLTILNWNSLEGETLIGRIASGSVRWWGNSSFNRRSSSVTYLLFLSSLRHGRLNLILLPVLSNNKNVTLLKENNDKNSFLIQMRTPVKIIELI